MKKILFVCLGNICRSPLGEGILKKLADDKDIELIVDSSGTSAYHVGETPDPRSIHVAAEHNIDIKNQHSRQVTKDDFYEYDYILAMDRSNLSNLYDLEPKDAKAKLHLLREFDEEKEKYDVPDPYYGGINGFEDCFQLIHMCCRNFIDEKINS